MRRASYSLRRIASSSTSQRRAAPPVGPAPGSGDNPTLSPVPPPDQSLVDENALMAKAKTQDNVDNFCLANHDANEGLAYALTFAGPAIGGVAKGLGAGHAAMTALDGIEKAGELYFEGYGALKRDDSECFWDKMPPDTTVSPTQIPPTQSSCTPDPQTLPADFAPPADPQVCR
jgi:hypothetical protein